MHQAKKKVLFSFLSLVFVCMLCGCSKEEKTFPIEELEDYTQPIVFLSSRETEETYFITLDEPDRKYELEYSKIWDSWPETQTFLFSQVTDEKESICRYDMVKKEYELLLTEDMVCEYLESDQDAEFSSVYYYFNQDVFSFVYGDNLLIYDVDAEEFVSCIPLSLNDFEEIYDWKTPQIFLMEGFHETYKVYEVNISSGSLERTEVAKKGLGRSYILTADGSMGCSFGDENILGVSFEPVLVWDTETYTVKRSKQGAWNTIARLQLSHDNKYVLLTRNHDEEQNRLLCLKVEDDSLCEVYAFDIDELIQDVLWWSE